MSRLSRSDEALDRLPGDVAAAFIFSDLRPPRGGAALLDWRLNGRLTRMLLDGEAVGRPGEHILVANNGKLAADWALFIGGGAGPDRLSTSSRKLLSHLLDVCRRAGFSRLAIGLSAADAAEAAALERTLAELLAETAAPELECRLVIDDDL